MDRSFQAARHKLYVTGCDMPVAAPAIGALNLVTGLCSSHTEVSCCLITHIVDSASKPSVTGRHRVYGHTQFHCAYNVASET